MCESSDTRKEELTDALSFWLAFATLPAEISKREQFPLTLLNIYTV